MKATIKLKNQQKTVSFDYAIENPGVYERVNHGHYYKYLIIMNNNSRFIERANGEFDSFSLSDRSGENDRFIPHPDAEVTFIF